MAQFGSELWLELESNGQKAQSMIAVTMLVTIFNVKDKP